MQLLRLLTLGSALLLVACGEAPAPVVQPAASDTPQFAGSEACETCHAAEYADWQASHHDLAMQVADSSTVLGDFDSAVFEYFGDETRFLRVDDAFVVRTANANGELQDFRVTHTFGVTPLQQYLVEFPNGGMQALPFAWDARAADEGGQRWYHLYPDEYIGPGDELHWTGLQQNWNYMCAECHSTNVELNYDVANDQFATVWSEINVGCEACHGPASVHVSNAQRGTLRSDYDLPVDLDDKAGAAWQMNLQTGIAERSKLMMHAPQQPESCGRCHARRGVIAEDYEYGAALSHTHRVSLLDEPLYFPDGQIRDEVYVYGSFLQSRMYAAGVTCSDCHNPHSLQLVTGDEPNAVCSQCHLPTRFAVAEHHQHGDMEVGCVDCHMASRTYMGVDDRRDHSFRIPRPALSQGSDVPNACNGCHTAETPEWAASMALQWWGDGADQQSRPVPGIVRATVLASLPLPLSREDADAVVASLRDGDPLVRISALRSAAGLAPETQVQVGAPLLQDRVRGVRLEAALLLASFRNYLPPASASAFLAAADEYRAAQRAVSSRPESHMALAEFEASLGNIEQALQHSGQALGMAPDNALLRHAHGLLLVRAGRADEGLVELEQAARLGPGESRFAYVYAVALNSLGQPAAAIETLEQARGTFPANFDIEWALATMLRDQGEIGKAAAIANELARRYPGDQNVTALLESLAAN